MTKLAKRSGKLIKGGEPDLHTVAVSMINDYQRVRTSLGPFFWF
jgi:ribosome biogenesis GTPase A